MMQIFHMFLQTPKVCIYPAVALFIESISAAVEFHVVAVSVCIESIDVVTRVVGVRRRPMRKTRALLKIVSNAAVLWYVVVATTVQEVATENCVACGRVVQ